MTWPAYQSGIRWRGASHARTAAQMGQLHSHVATGWQSGVRHSGYRRKVTALTRSGDRRLINWRAAGEQFDPMDRQTSWITARAVKSGKGQAKDQQNSRHLVSDSG